MNVCDACVYVSVKVCVKCSCSVLNHLCTKVCALCVCVCCVFWSSQQSGGNICTQWHRPSAFTHGSCRATLHGLAGCDLPEAPGELFLLKASCASYFLPAKYSTVQLFTWEAWSTALLLPLFYIFGEPLCWFKRAWSIAPVMALLLLPEKQSLPFTLCLGYFKALQCIFIPDIYSVSLHAVSFCSHLLITLAVFRTVDSTLHWYLSVLNVTPRDSNKNRWSYKRLSIFLIRCMCACDAECKWVEFICVVVPGNTFMFFRATSKDWSNSI